MRADDNAKLKIAAGVAGRASTHSRPNAPHSNFITTIATMPEDKAARSIGFLHVDAFLWASLAPRHDIRATFIPHSIVWRTYLIGFAGETRWWDRFSTFRDEADAGARMRAMRRASREYVLSREAKMPLMSFALSRLLFLISPHSAFRFVRYRFPHFYNISVFSFTAIQRYDYLLDGERDGLGAALIDIYCRGGWCSMGFWLERRWLL